MIENPLQVNKNIKELFIKKTAYMQNQILIQKKNAAAQTNNLN